MLLDQCFISRSSLYCHINNNNNYNSEQYVNNSVFWNAPLDFCICRRPIGCMNSRHLHGLSVIWRTVWVGWKPWPSKMTKPKLYLHSLLQCESICIKPPKTFILKDHTSQANSRVLSIAWIQTNGHMTGQKGKVKLAQSTLHLYSFCIELNMILRG